MPSIRTRFDVLWHRSLKRPYALNVAIDEGERGADTVVMLHGIGRMGTTWRPLVRAMQGMPCRMVAFDLLGFGTSPKPSWPQYNTDQHADAVIHSIEKPALKKPVVIVGHSMGCLIAVRVAVRRPDLVRHLVLYEMPLYAGLPDTRRYKLRLNFYFGVYKRMVELKPAGAKEKRRLRQRVVEALLGFPIQEESWRPFTRSLKHTIMEQTTHLDIKKLKMPMDVIYGSRDRIVIRGETKLLFGEDVPNVQSHLIREKHRITATASTFLAARVQAALQDKTKLEIKRQEPLV